jgi:hypothetical protein
LILWHFGTTLVILWFVFRGNTRMDYRFALLGSILPDLIDKPLGRIVLRNRYHSGRLFGHTLLLNVAAFALLFFMRGRRKRKAVLLPIGSLLHLAEDGMWSRPGVFWWPAFGTAFPRGSGGMLRLSWTSIAMELVGAGLIVWIFAAHGMLNRDGLKAFLRTGMLEIERTHR